MAGRKGSFFTSSAFSILITASSAEPVPLPLIDGSELLPLFFYEEALEFLEDLDDVLCSMRNLFSSSSCSS